MAWVAPRDWSDNSDVPNGIVTAAMLNVDVRDNLGVLSTHQHTGAAGMGAASMSGLTLTNLGVLTFANQSANPDAAGELQRNGNDLLWYDGSSVVNLTQGDASAGTASLRTLGTTSVKAAAGDHTHGIDEIGASSSQSARGTYANSTWFLTSSTAVSDTEYTLGSAITPTFTGANMGRVTAGFWCGGHNDDGAAYTYTLRLYINDVLKASTSVELLAASSSARHHAYGIAVEYTEESATSGQEVDIRIIRDAGGSADHFTVGYGLTNTFCNAQ
jgi:hypothetical protein